MPSQHDMSQQSPGTKSQLLRDSGVEQCKSIDPPKVSPGPARVPLAVVDPNTVSQNAEATPTQHMLTMPATHVADDSYFTTLGASDYNSDWMAINIFESLKKYRLSTERMSVPLFTVRVC